MPGFDGTGPEGRGEMTGGGRGYCVVPVRGEVYSGRGMRFLRRGMGRGAGRGFGRGFREQKIFLSESNSEVNKNELAVLKKEAECLKTELENIYRQINMLEQQ